MSFGYRSEFKALFTLTHKVRKELVGAPSQFKEISDKFVTLIINQQMLTTRYNRVSTLSNVLQDIDLVSSQSELDNEQRTDLQRVTASCRSILIDLEDAVNNHDELGSSHGDPSETLKRVGKRKIWKPSDIRDLQDRITTNIELLDAYLRQISKKDSVELKNNDDQSLLWWAAVSSSNVANIKLLLDAGADIESKDDSDRTPLCLAACRDNMDIANLLINAGADVNSKDNNDRTPLRWAACIDNINIVKLLLNAGADVNSKDNNNRTPLLEAVQNNNMDIVKLLLDAGADVNSKDNNNRTPLLEAVQNNNMDIVKLLLDAGGDVN